MRGWLSRTELPGAPAHVLQECTGPPGVPPAQDEGTVPRRWCPTLAAARRRGGHAPIVAPACGRVMSTGSAEPDFQRAKLPPRPITSICGHAGLAIVRG